MILKSTYTFALMEVPWKVYDFVARQLKKAGYDHAFNDCGTDGICLDMHGIALQKDPSKDPSKNFGGEWATRIRYDSTDNTAYLWLDDCPVISTKSSCEVFHLGVIYTLAAGKGCCHLTVLWEEAESIEQASEYHTSSHSWTIVDEKPCNS